MAKAFKIAGTICAAGVVICTVFFHLAGRAAPADTAPRADAAIPKTARSAALDGDMLLFPALDSAAVTSLSVRTPDLSYEFLSNGTGGVSVNGRQADAEIYATLLEQLTTLPVQSTAPFPAGDAQPLLTLTLCADGQTHVARFYADGQAGETARIIAGSADMPVYRLTDGWRIGKLMMTCEGTRIQDERGNETPSGF